MGIVSQVIVRALDQEPPFFSADRCLNRRQTRHPCTLCHDRCTGGALPLNPVIEKIEWGKCIGCGICVSACPARCFAPDLRQQQNMAAPQKGEAVTLACAHTKEPVGERRVECLCGLPWEWLASLAMRTRVQLYVGECEGCAVSGCREQLLENLAQLRAFLGEQRFDEQILLCEDAAAMTRQESERKVDRRSLFGMMGRGVKTSVAASVIHALPAPKDDPAQNGFAYRRLLADLVRAQCVACRERAKAENKKTEYPEYGVLLPDFGAKCHGCGVCARVCPHQAITMEKETEQTSIISIEPWKCTGCGLCQAVCQHGGIPAIALTQVHHLEKQGYVRVYHACCSSCGAVIPRGTQDGLCIVCSVKKNRGRR